MELTTVAVILSAISSLIAIITAGSTAIFAFAVLRTEVNQIKTDVKLLWGHANDEHKHFNREQFTEFRQLIDLRFTNLEKQNTEIKEYVEDIDGKLDKLKTDLKV